MSDKAKEVFEVESLTVPADKGYYDGQDIAVCEGKGIRCLVAKPRAGGSVWSEEFRREAFVYDMENNEYICPCKIRLRAYP
jgi:hypothetical protein